MTHFSVSLVPHNREYEIPMRLQSKHIHTLVIWMKRTIGIIRVRLFSRHPVSNQLQEAECSEEVRGKPVMRNNWKKSWVIVAFAPSFQMEVIEMSTLPNYHKTEDLVV